MAGLKNSEGYPDPTAEKAIRNADKSRDDLSRCVHMTYLIGEHKSKMKAEAYCKSQGMAVMPQTVTALTDEEYRRAWENREMEA